MAGDVQVTPPQLQGPAQHLPRAQQQQQQPPGSLGAPTTAATLCGVMLHGSSAGPCCPGSLRAIWSSDICTGLQHPAQRFRALPGTGGRQQGNTTAAAAGNCPHPPGNTALAWCWVQAHWCRGEEGGTEALLWGGTTHTHTRKKSYQQEQQRAGLCNSPAGPRGSLLQRPAQLPPSPLLGPKPPLQLHTYTHNGHTLSHVTLMHTHCPAGVWPGLKAAPSCCCSVTQVAPVAPG